MKKLIQVYPYFWQTYVANYEAKSRDELVNFVCQLLYGILSFFPNFLYCQSLLPF